MFSVPLCAFLQHKYSDIYQEYVSLYNRMTTEHPGRKKLVTSETFRRWKVDNPKPSAAVSPLQQTFGETSGLPQKSQEQEDQLPENGSETVRAAQDILNQQQEDTEFNRLSEEIDDLINELIANQGVPEIMEQPVEDVGIELNLADEVYSDIGPPDYALEVELNTDN